MGRTSLALLFCFCLGRVARAEQCPVIEGGSPELGALDAEARLQFLHARLLEDGNRARVWWISWLSFLSTAEAVQLAAGSVGAAVPVPPERPSNHFARFVVNLLHEDQVSLFTGSVTTAGGILSLAIVPSRPALDGPAFDLRLRSRGLEDPCTLIAEGERMLLRDAQDEAGRRAPLAHILNAAVNVVASLVVGIFFHQWVAAAINGALGVGIGELLILTVPTGAEQALAQYRGGAWGPSPPAAARPSLSISGFSLALSF